MCRVSNFPFTFKLCLFFGCCLALTFLLLRPNSNKIVQDCNTSTSNSASAVQLVDSNLPIKDNFTCIRTKQLFNLYSTTICLYSENDAVSNELKIKAIWEEEYVTKLLQILIANPALDMIDIGANIGSYTMYVAGALGRFTLVVDCYLPNIRRIAKAVQVQNVQNRVVLVNNALFSESGNYIKLSHANPSGIELGSVSSQDSIDQFIARTIRLDDLIPILREKQVRTAAIKIDIEGSESYMCDTGSALFDFIDIQIVMMEWGHGFRKSYPTRYQSIINFFTQREYLPTDTGCTELKITEWANTWPGNIYWIKKTNFKKNIC